MDAGLLHRSTSGRRIGGGDGVGIEEFGLRDLGNEEEEEEMRRVEGRLRLLRQQKEAKLNVSIVVFIFRRCGTKFVDRILGEYVEQEEE